MDDPSIDREWKKGSAELLLLSLLEAMPRHGYELGKLIEQRSEGALRPLRSRGSWRACYTASARPIRRRWRR